MKISGYFTAKNAIEQNYPIESSIRSLFNIVDEIVVCDNSDKNDGTKELLESLKNEFKGEFKIVRNPECDWSRPDYGRFDGENKAYAKSQCTGDYCLQFDLDELLVGNRKQIERLCLKTSESYPILALPVIEPWGSQNKIRIDINIWKWRIYKNLPWLTHGIPNGFKEVINGFIYAKPGTDGSDPIDIRTGNRVEVINFVPAEIEQVRRQAVFNQNFVKQYGDWVNMVTDRMPYVLHYSWWSVYHKMIKYRNFFNDYWFALYGQQLPKDWNPFGNKSLEEMTDDEMRETAKKIEDGCAGFIFHQKIDLNNIPKTNHFEFNKPLVPGIIKVWAEKNKT